MKKVSINELHELTDKDRRTIKKHLHGIERDPDGRYNSAQALQTFTSGIPGRPILKQYASWRLHGRRKLGSE